MKIKIIIISLIIGLTSCTKEHELRKDDLISQSQKNISVNMAKEIALNFASSINMKTKHNNSLSVSSVKHIIQSSPLTKAQSSDIDTLMHIVNFNEDNGFAVISAVNIENPVLAYIPEGNYDENNTNPGFDLFIEQSSDFIKAKSNLGNIKDIIIVNPDSWMSWKIYYSAPNRLKINWHQGYPYNYNCPNYPNSVAGCVPIAVAQILSFYKKPSSLSYRTRDNNVFLKLDWDKILAECISNNGEIIHDNSIESYYGSPNHSLITQYGNQVIFFIRHIGYEIGAEYGKTTSASNDKALKYIRSLGLSAPNVKNYNTSAITQALDNSNKLVYMSGFRTKNGVKYSNGHAWVIDGYIKAKSNADGKDYTLMHCNWGWGRDYNGFYYSEVFDVYNKCVFHDNDGELLILKSNSSDDGERYYKYKLQYSIIN